MNKNDFPIFKNNPKLIYFDNAATSQKPQCVIDKELEFYTKYNANVHRGLYNLSEKASEMYENARNTVAKFINASSEEIVFTSGATEAINMIATMVSSKTFFPANEEETILATVMEHHSNFLPWQKLTERPNVYIEFLELLENFQLDKKKLHEIFRKRNVKVLAITHMSNVLGTINPIKEIVSFVRKNSPQTIIVLDAAQSIAHMPLDVKDLDVDFCVFSGHKVFGPTGIGVLYGKKYLLSVMDPPIRGGGMINKVTRDSVTWADLPEKFEAGTPNIAGAIGLGTAIEYLTGIGFSEIINHEKNLIQIFLEKLKANPNLTLYGPKTAENRGAVFSMNLKDLHPHDVADLLNENDIAVRAGHHCAQILMRDVLDVPATLRVSLSFYNTSEEIEKFFEVMAKIKNILQ